TMARALRPSACTDDGLPVTSNAASTAPRASGRSGAVAFQSRYVRPVFIDWRSFPAQPGFSNGGDAQGLLGGWDAVDDLPQRDAFQEDRNLVAERIPQTMRQAALAGHAGFGRLAAAAGHTHVFLDRAHDLADRDAAGRAAQAIAAQTAAGALHQAGAAQLEEQLLEVG